MDMKKPVSEMTKKEKEEFRAFIRALPDDWLSKKSLETAFGAKEERTVRRKIEKLRQKENVPYMSHSKQKGYKIARYKEDYADAKHTYLELHSRAKKILESAKPLEEFCAKCERGEVKSKYSEVV